MKKRSIINVRFEWLMWNERKSSSRVINDTIEKQRSTMRKMKPIEIKKKR